MHGAASMSGRLGSLIQVIYPVRGIFNRVLYDSFGCAISPFRTVSALFMRGGGKGNMGRRICRPILELAMRVCYSVLLLAEQSAAISVEALS